MYAKLFTSIYQGTLRGNSHGLLVFTNMIAHCDKAGHCDMHPKAIAEEVGLTIEQVKAAIEGLESPDDESRSPEENGRRIKRLDEHRAWGWVVVNYLKYRSIRDEEDRREQNRQSQEAWRLRKQNKPPSAAVSHDKPQSAHTEAEADTEKRIARASRLPTSWKLPKAWGEWSLTEFPNWTAATVRLEADKFADFWRAKAGKDATKTDWCATWRNWCRNAKAPTATAAPTVSSREADKTKDYLESQALSEEERVAADEARRRVLSAVKRVA